MTTAAVDYGASFHWQVKKQKMFITDVNLTVVIVGMIIYIWLRCTEDNSLVASTPVGQALLITRNMVSQCNEQFGKIAKFWQHICIYCPIRDYLVRILEWYSSNSTQKAGMIWLMGVKYAITSVAVLIQEQSVMNRQTDRTAITVITLSKDSCNKNAVPLNRLYLKRKSYKKPFCL